MLVRIQSGNPPDVAIFPQPGLLSQIVNDTGSVKPLSEDLEAFAKQYFPEDWMNYGVVNDISFGLPNNADFKSLVWYNPKIWAGEGLEGSDHLGGTADPADHDLRRRHQAVVRWASDPVRRPVGTPPTGWRSTSSGSPARTSTTSG